MLNIKTKRFVILSITALILLFTTGCSSGTKNDNTTDITTNSSLASAITRPAPVILSVSDTTSGMENNYYAILKINVKNEGSSGTILIHASLTQNGRTATNDMVTYIDQKTTQEIDLVFPLEWGGGTWTQAVQVSVP
jgi:hypothetical protein